MTRNAKWNNERSHESYAKNYSMVFPHDEPLASRGMRKDPFHDVNTPIYYILTIFSWKNYEKLPLYELSFSQITVS